MFLAFMDMKISDIVIKFFSKKIANDYIHIYEKHSETLDNLLQHFIIFYNNL